MNTGVAIADWQFFTVGGDAPAGACWFSARTMN
jgi:hypothetical protein